jgi:hypothetical protein
LASRHELEDPKPIRYLRGVSTAAQRNTPGPCELCGRETALSFHHLIPRKNHRKRRFKKRYSTQELKSRGLWLCSLCHRQIHRFYSEDELGRRLNTREALLQEPEMQRFLRWARKQRP